MISTRLHEFNTRVL
jgi:hypothetical protein